MAPPVPGTSDPVFTAADLDPTVDPGEDFFAFANGGWLAANPVPEEYPRWGAFDEVRKANEDLLHALLEEAAADPGTPGTVRHWSGLYYRAGMDTDAIESAALQPLQYQLDRIGRIGNSNDLRSVAADLMEYGISLPVAMGVAPDFEDSGRHLLYVGQGGMGLPERDYYFRDDAESVETRRRYRELITRVFDLAGIDDGEEAAGSVLELETQLAEAAFTATQLRDPDLTFNRFAADELAGLMPGYQLTALLSGAGADGYESANVSNPDFLRAGAELLTHTPPATLQHYARWRLLGATASALPGPFDDAAFEFYGKRLGGQKRQKERWQRVLRAASAEIPQIIAQLYVAAAFPPEAKARVEDLVGHLIASMQASIEAVPWMSNTTRRRALEKLAGFTPKLGYPDRWRDHTRLAFDEAAPWVTMRLAARSFEFRRRLDQLHDPVDPHEWEMGAHEVNAYYHPLRNEIVFPAGILQPPFFSPEADDAVNYGAIGAVIGHEITHGFDDKGSRFDADGHLANWWTDEDRAEFDQRAQVLVDQFASYEPLEGLHVNGELTLGENIADLGGLTIAFEALQRSLAEKGRYDVDGMTPEQRFFLAYARTWRANATDEYTRLIVQTDPHSPSRYRCNGVVANMPEFADAFDLGDAAPIMRPPEARAKIW